MEEITMNYNVAKKLTKNTFTRQDYNFGGWNTKADGTGTYYEDEQEVNFNTYVDGNEINLYAQWIEDGKYKVVFNANGGTGTMTPQDFAIGTPQNLTTSTFTKDDFSFAFWNTKADGTGTTYQDGQKVHSLVANKGENITLYAIYEKFSYEHEDDLVFDGTNYIDTNIYLFSEKNINKDFEISFEIKDYTYANDQNSLISAMDERASPWPGFVFRFTKSNQFEINSNTTSSVKGSKQYGLKEVNKVIIKRTNNILYVNINDGTEQQIIDFSTIKQPFYAPTSIGASLNGNLQPQRYFTGTLSNVRITVNQ